MPPNRSLSRVAAEILLPHMGDPLFWDAWDVVPPPACTGEEHRWSIVGNHCGYAVAIACEVCGHAQGITFS